MTKRFMGVRSVARNSAYLLANQAASLLIRFAYLFVLVRAVTPAAYGALNYALAWYLVLLPITYLGTDIILGRDIGRKQRGAATLLGSTLGLRLGAALLVTAASIGAAMLIEADASVRTLLVLFSLALVGRSLWMWCGSVFTAFEQAHLILRFEIASRMLEIAALIALLRTAGAILWAIAVVHAASWLLQALVAIVAISRRYDIAFHLPQRRWFRVLRDGIPGAVFSIAMAAFFQLPVVLFRHFAGIGDSLGNFALGFQIVTYLLAIPYLVAQAALPVLSRQKIRDGAHPARAIHLLLAAVFVGASAMAGVGSFIAKPAIIALFGVSYASAATVLSGGLWLLVPASLAMLMQQVLFSIPSQRVIATFAPLAGVVAMAASYPTFVSASSIEAPLWAVGIGLLTWFVFAYVGSTLGRNSMSAAGNSSPQPLASSDA